MLFDGNYHSPHAFFNNQIRVFEGKEVLLLNPSLTRFATHFLLMMRTLLHKYLLRVTLQLQEFIVLKLRKEEGNVAMIKNNQSFNQRHIFIKMEKPLFIILRMASSNHPHTDKLWIIALTVDDIIRMSMPELNDEN